MISLATYLSATEGLLQHAREWTFTKEQAHFKSSMALMCLCLLSILAFSVFNGKNQTSKSQTALLAFITPTFDPRPSKYASLISHSTHDYPKIIRIQASLLLANICAGKIELRDDSDLTRVFHHHLRVHGWSIHLVVDFSLRVSVMRWILLSRYPTVTTHKYNHNVAASKHRNTLDQLFPPVSGNILVSEICHLQSTSNLKTAVHLDFIPFCNLEHTLSVFLSHLEPGSFASFEFTTIAPYVSFLCDSFVFCSLPFMPRKYVKNDKMPCRTSTPLLISLSHIIELLTSEASPPIVESITNVTSAQITILKHRHQELVQKRTLRSAFIQKWSKEAWREHRLMLSWEIGLLAAGYLAKWIVVIRK